MSTYAAWFFDGTTAIRRVVQVQIISQSFFLNEQERRHGPFDFDQLRYTGKQQNADVYSLEDHDGWRLGISGDVPSDLAAMLPAKRKYGGWIDTLGLGPASVAFAVISAAAVAVVLFSPQWLAPLIPASTEQKIGNALVGDFGGRFCHTKAGDAALKKLAGKLDDNLGELQVEVAKIDMVNAIALPGGKIIIFNGLLNEARSPDEVAGVLAHEMGHVRERHVMQSLLRQLGLSIVLGGMDGADGGMLNNVLSLSYSRDAENEADAHSIKKLAKSKISPIATAGFFDRMAALDGSAYQNENDTGASIAVYMSSHPLSLARKKAFELSLIKGGDYKPALTSDEWTELKTMCAQDRKAKSGFGLGFDDSE
jgi:beta-barrel assembly-enhancing protease